MSSKYSLEEIYFLVGRDDRSTAIFFKPTSNSYKLYGRYITVVLAYTQKERELLEKNLTNGIVYSDGILKARYLVGEHSEELRKRLLEEGFYSKDILLIKYLNLPPENTFNSKDKRKVRKAILPMRPLPKGGDYKWIYGFKKHQIANNVGLSTHEMNQYYAMKLFFEPEKLTEAERKTIYNEAGIKSEIEYEYLKVKYNTRTISEDENNLLNELNSEDQLKRLELLKKELLSAGTSLKRLINTDKERAGNLLNQIENFIPQRLNTDGIVPIYLDLEGFLHIIIRHSEDFEVSTHFSKKDNYQWSFDDILFVMEEVIEALNDEVQKFWEINPGQRFSKYGDQSYYFEGDYYTVHIEGNGRLSTLYKNKKGTI